MCLIIHKENKGKISRDLLERAIHTNSDGWGIVQPTGKRLKILRGLSTTSFFKCIEKMEEPCTIHFRLATHGDKTVENTHPYEFKAGNFRYAVMHNGILNIPIEDTKKSDTWHFCDNVLKPILTSHGNRFGDKYLTNMLGELVGSYNKMVIYRHDGKSIIINERMGTVHENMWLSNNYSVSHWSHNSSWREYDNYQDYIGDKYDKKYTLPNSFLQPCQSEKRENIKYFDTKTGEWKDWADYELPANSYYTLDGHLVEHQESHPFRNSVPELEPEPDLSLSDFTGMDEEEILAFIKEFPKHVAEAIVFHLEETKNENQATH